MSGTRIGGIKAAESNKKKYGEDFYRKNGHKGGIKCGVKKGFAANPELARKAGAIGGMKSKRGKAKKSVE